jgi:hypothetical protein
VGFEIPVVENPGVAKPGNFMMYSYAKTLGKIMAILEVEAQLLVEEQLILKLTAKWIIQKDNVGAFFGAFED